MASSSSRDAVPIKDEVTPRKPSVYLLLVGLNAAIGGFALGYATTSIDAALLQAKHTDQNKECPGLDNEEMTTSEQENVISALSLGAILSSLVAGLLSGVIGRRKTILVSACLTVWGTSWMSTSGFIMTLICGRFVLGLGVGLNFHTMPMWIAESAPKEIRGRLCGIYGLMICIAQTSAASIAAYCFRMEIAEGWRYMMGFGIVPAVFLFIVSWMQPESPRYFMSIGQENAARESLALLRGRDSTDPDLVAELLELLDAVRAECRPQSQSEFHVTYWMNPRVRRALLLGCGLQFLQQCCGIESIMFYGATIFEHYEADQSDSSELCFPTASKNAVMLTAYFTASQSVGVLLSCCYVDSLGRRPLLLASLLGTCLSLLALGFAFHAVNVSITVVVVLVLAYTMMFGIGLGPLPIIVNAEIYPMNLRGTCIAMAAAAHWVSSFLVCEAFLSLSSLLSTYGDDSEHHPDGIFWLFASIAAVGSSIAWLKFPETKGLALEGMDGLFVDPDEFHAE
eukprot:TRINITY_DN25660_c0_g1_i1.p1 TRINITY_DN25660_c0_g1~~TRINITY_DN25660_c0_g1_i1.p1  ORF type:complete len:511 (-),score=50.75 TRINITY_DN25660_c0_g1_i1:175-1707(-)